jgi:hypothetical protein
VTHRIADDVLALGAAHYYDQAFLPALRAELGDLGMDEAQIDEVLEIVLPQLRERAARRLH